MSGKGTVDAVFVLRKFTKKIRFKSKKLFFVLLDQEKAFDRVPREIRARVPEYLVNEVHCTKTVQLIFQSREIIRFFFCESWCS